MFLAENFPVRELNTFNIDVTARYFAEITSPGELQYLLNDPGFKGEKKMIIGGGSNILFTDNFNGLLIRNSIKGITLKEENGVSYVTAGAGEIWDDLVCYCVSRNLAGLENLSLIPGTVGAAPIQNIGAYGTEAKDTFFCLEGIDLLTGEKRVLEKAECRFGYRDSIFKQELKGRFAITSVTFRLKAYTAPDFCYEGLRRAFEGHSGEITIEQVRETIIRIRTSKLPDTKLLGNAGSFFKNPEVGEEKFAELKNNHPDIPGFGTNGKMVKIPAGWLIEKAGFRGKRVGNTGAYEKQALVLVNYGGATGGEIRDFAETIQKTVKEMFGVEIHMEVNVV